MQRVWSKGDEILECHSAGDIFDVRIEATILMDHEHGGKLAGRLRGLDEIAPNFAVARCWDLDVLGLDALIRRRNLLSLGELRAERVEECGAAHAGDRDRPGSIDEIAARDLSVHVLVEELE